MDSPNPQPSGNVADMSCPQLLDVLERKIREDYPEDVDAATTHLTALREIIHKDENPNQATEEEVNDIQGVNDTNYMDELMKTNP